MVFTKRLREGVRRGQITCSVRIWMRPHVKVGGRYRMGEGEIEVESILPIEMADITPDLARASGFKGVVDLLKVAKHGRGENVYLVRFHYVAPGRRSKRRGLWFGRRDSDLRRQVPLRAGAVSRDRGSGQRRRLQLLDVHEEGVRAQHHPAGP